MIFIEAKLEVIGKPEPKDWKLDNGTKGTTHKINVAQNEGVDVATIKCPENVYNTVRRGDVATFLCSFTEYDSRSEFKIVDLIKIDPVKSASVPAIGGSAK